LAFFAAYYKQNANKVNFSYSFWMNWMEQSESHSETLETIKIFQHAEKYLEKN